MTKKKVMLGMSGGVDSSVAAAILLDKGYDVIGVTMQIWPDMDEDIKKTEGGCCSLSAVDDARRVATRLGIPYYVLNFKEVFQDKVIDYFKEEYFKGRTPNPCIACNRYVKFEAMLNKAASMGIDYVATGHYAIIEYDENRKRYLLKKSITDRKDQTYALYNLTQEQLSRTLMPVGDFTKERVREIAKEIGLSVATKPDSQEICFVDDNDYGRFIAENTDRDILPGNFVDTKGKVLGRHKGIVHYTVGQRKGLGIALGKPMFVVEIDVEKNRVVLGDATEVFSDSLIASDMNYISIEKLEGEMRVKAKIRYSAKEADATVYPIDNGQVKVVFDSPQRAITPGQAVVFYDGDIVVGGGTIEK
ncbi:MAG: tRNA 2-thiouridine(34) synthase MnmA [Clostridia bacterium]|nr:tRNA 2-thiouridine(34) synthase MnmA [Clostridia bacterium]